MPVDNIPDVVRRLKTLRLINGMSQHALAKKAGLGVNTVNAGESGALARGWPIESLLKYAAVFGMSIGLTSNADWPDLSRYDVGELATLATMVTDELVRRTGHDGIPFGDPGRDGPVDFGHQHGPGDTEDDSDSQGDSSAIPSP